MRLFWLNFNKIKEFFLVKKTAPFKGRVDPLHGDLCVQLIQDPFGFILARNYGKRPNNSEEICQNVLNF